MKYLFTLVTIISATFAHSQNHGIGAIQEVNGVRYEPSFHAIYIESEDTIVDADGNEIHLFLSLPCELWRSPYILTENYSYFERPNADSLMREFEAVLETDRINELIYQEKKRNLPQGYRGAPKQVFHRIVPKVEGTEKVEVATRIDGSIYHAVGTVIENSRHAMYFRADSQLDDEQRYFIADALDRRKTRRLKKGETEIPRNPPAKRFEVSVQLYDMELIQSALFRLPNLREKMGSFEACAAVIRP